MKVLSYIFEIPVSKAKFTENLENWLSTEGIGYCDGYGSGIGSDTKDYFFYIDPKKEKEVDDYWKEIVRINNIECEFQPRNLKDVNEYDLKYIKSLNESVRIKKYRDFI